MDTLTRAEMAELDRIMIEEMGIDVARMMEYAGLFPAQFAMKNASGKRITVLAGHGNNGGDGLCCARHLANFGFDVRVFLARENLSEHCAYQRGILQKMGVQCEVYSGEQLDADLLIDALLGYNLHGNPREPYASIITAANSSGIPILSIDVPSGLDANSGAPGTPCITARWTLALSGAKQGCAHEIAKPFVGELFVAYLSVPRSAYEKIGKKAPELTGAIEKFYL